MAEFGRWFEELGPRLIDTGNPVARAVKVDDGSVRDGGGGAQRVPYQIKGSVSAPAVTERMHEMANYLFAYSGPAADEVAADEAERSALMAKWGQWFGQLGSAVVDGGGPTGKAKTVSKGGSVSDGGSLGLTGYCILAADSLDAAVKLTKGCPVFEVGGSVDVYEAITMM